MYCENKKQNTKNPVLYSVYSSVVTLKEFIRIVTLNTNNKSFENKKINIKKKKRKKEDLTLLHEVLVGMHDKPPLLELQSASFAPEEILMHALEVLFNREAFPSNVLAKGHRRQITKHLHGIDGALGLECYHPNTLHNIFNRKEWVKLHSMVGDAVYLHLLMSTSLFVPLPNQCYFQVTGKPLYDEIRERGSSIPPHLFVKKSLFKAKISRFPTNRSSLMKRLVANKLPHSNTTSLIGRVNKQPHSSDNKRSVSSSSKKSDHSSSVTTKRNNISVSSTTTNPHSRTIHRSHIFYGKVAQHRAGLPIKHHLNTIGVSKRGGRRLVMILLGKKKYKSHPTNNNNNNNNNNNSKDVIPRGKVALSKTCTTFPPLLRAKSAQSFKRKHILHGIKSPSKEPNMKSRRVSVGSRTTTTTTRQMAIRKKTSLRKRSSSNPNLLSHGNSPQYSSSSTSNHPHVRRSSVLKKGRRARASGLRRSFSTRGLHRSPSIQRPCNNIKRRKINGIEPTPHKKHTEKITTTTTTTTRQEIQQTEEKRYKKRRKVIRLTKVEQQLVPVCQMMVRRHIKCNYQFLIEHHCPLPELNDKGVFVKAKRRTPPTPCKRSTTIITSPSSSSDEGLLYNFFDTQPQTQMIETQVMENSFSTQPHVDMIREESSIMMELNKEEPSIIELGKMRARALHKPLEKKERVASLLPLFSSHREVASFVKAVVIRVVPVALWGSRANRTIVLKNIDTFVRLQRFESIRVNELIQDIKTSHMAWLTSGNANNEKNKNKKNKKKGQDGCVKKKQGKRRRRRRRRRGCRKKKVQHDKKEEENKDQEEDNNNNNNNNYDGMITNNSNNNINNNDGVSCVQVKECRLGHVMEWLFDQIVVPLIRNNFYVTESSGHGLRVFYYRKPLWARIQQHALVSLFPRNFELLDTEEARQVLGRRKIGHSFVRFLPKESGGLRPIVNLSRRTATPPTSPAAHLFGTQSTSINTILRPTFRVLSFEKERNKKSVGSSVFSYTEIYRKLVGFRWKVLGAERPRHGHSRLPKLYMACVDVKGAFDSINQRKLMESVILDEGLVSLDEYLFVRYARSSAVPRLGKIAVQFTEDVRPPFDFPQFPEFAKDVVVSKGMARTVLTDQVTYRFVDRDTVYALLTEHIFFNMVSHEGHLYRQTVGIPQGSILSSLLCSLFYGHMENNHPALRDLPKHDIASTPLPNFFLRERAAEHNSITLRSPSHYTTSISITSTLLNTQPETQEEVSFLDKRNYNRYKNKNNESKNNESEYNKNKCNDNGLKPHSHELAMMMRMIDDFFYVSTSKKLVRKFVNVMHKGLPDYGCVINTAKTKVNFSMTLDEVEKGRGNVKLNTHKEGGGDEYAGFFMPWCGLLVNSKTLAVRYDYSRYRGTYISASLTAVRWKPGVSLRRRMLAHVSLKLHALLLDENHNGTFTVRLNVYQVFLIGAMKFHAIVSAFPKHCSGRSRIHQPFLVRVVKEMVDYAFRLTHTRTGVKNSVAQEMQARCDVSFDAVAWLALKAFTRVLIRKHTSYHGMLKWISNHIKEINKRMKDQYKDKKYRRTDSIHFLFSVINSPANDVFDDILY